MIDPFVKRMIVKYHNQGRTDIEIAVITGQPLSQVRQFLEKLAKEQAQSSLDKQSNDQNSTNKHNAASNIALSTSKSKAKSPQDKTSRPITLQASNSNLSKESIESYQEANAHSFLKDKGMHQPVNAQDLTCTSNDNQQQHGDCHQGLSLKDKAEDKPCQSEGKKTRHKILDDHKELVSLLLEQCNFNCHEVQRHLLAHGINVKIRTLQRFCEPLIKEYYHKLSEHMLNSLSPNSTSSQESNSPNSFTEYMNANNNSGLKQNNESMQSDNDSSLVSSSIVMANNVVTIPKSIRTAMDITIGDRLMFIYRDGKAILCKYPNSK